MINSRVAGIFIWVPHDIIKGEGLRTYSTARHPSLNRVNRWQPSNELRPTHLYDCWINRYQCCTCICTSCSIHTWTHLSYRDWPVVESTLILQALVHSAVDGGLGPFTGGLEEKHEWHIHQSLPQGQCGPHVAAELGPDDSRMEAVCCYSRTYKRQHRM